MYKGKATPPPNRNFWQKHYDVSMYQKISKLSVWFHRSLSRYNLGLPMTGWLDDWMNPSTTKILRILDLLLGQVWDYLRLKCTTYSVSRTCARLNRTTTPLSVPRFEALTHHQAGSCTHPWHVGKNAVSLGTIVRQQPKISNTIEYNSIIVRKATKSISLIRPSPKRQAS